MAFEGDGRVLSSGATKSSRGKPKSSAQGEQGNSPTTQPHHYAKARDCPFRYMRDGRVLKTGESECRRSTRKTVVDTNRKMKAYLENDGAVVVDPPMSNINEKTSSHKKGQTNKRSDSKAFKTSGRVLKSGEVVQVKKRKAVEEDSQGKDTAPTKEDEDQEILTAIYLRKRLPMNASDFVSAAVTRNVVESFLNKSDQQLYKKEVMDRAEIDVARTVAEAVLRGAYTVDIAKEEEELGQDEEDDYGQEIVREDKEGTLCVSFEPIPGDLSVNNKGGTKKVVFLHDEVILKDEIEELYAILDQRDKLDWFHAHKFAWMNPRLFWSIVYAYKRANENNHQAPFRDMLENIMPDRSWSFVVQRECDIQRSRNFSVVGAESNKYLQSEFEKAGGRRKK